MAKKEGSYLIKVRMNRSSIVGFVYVSYTGVLTDKMLHYFNAIYDLTAKRFLKCSGKSADQERTLVTMHEKCKHVDHNWMVANRFDVAKPKLEIKATGPNCLRMPLHGDGLSGSMNFSAGEIAKAEEFDRPIGISSSFHEDVTGQRPDDGTGSMFPLLS